MNIHGLICKILERKGKKVELEIEGQKVAISTEYLPAGCESGSSLRLYILSENDGLVHEKKLAKLILDEILNGK